MNLPSKHTKLGRVLRAMIDAGPMTSGDVRKKAGLHPDTAVTARIRDLRKMGIQVLTWSEPHLFDEHKRVWQYKVVHVPKMIRKALADERKREKGMGVAA